MSAFTKLLMPPVPPDSIVGIPIAHIRSLFKIRNPLTGSITPLYGSEHFQEKFDLSISDAREMVRQLQQLGYLSSERDENSLYEVTKRGKLFGLEKSNKPIAIEKADTLYAEFLDRIKVVNESPEFILKVAGFSMWGDYVNGESPITTIEIDLILGHKDADSYDEKRNEKYKTMSRRLGFEEQATLPLTEIRKFLKAKSPYLSIYFWWEESTLNNSSEKFFDADGIYLYTKSQKGSKPEKPVNNQSINQIASTGLPGRLILNEREGKSSKKQIVRRHAEKEQELENMHGRVLDGMVDWLRKQYPECIISPECLIGGLAGRIDIARKTKDGAIILYEIKTYPKAIISIRMALGQLLEYSFYPDRKLSKEFYIVSHVAARKADLQYLKHIGEMIGIKIDYLHFNCDTCQVEIGN